MYRRYVRHAVSLWTDRCLAVALLDLVQLISRDHHGTGVVINRSQLDKVSLGVYQGFLEVPDQLRHIVITAVGTLLGTFVNDLHRALW